MQLKINAELKEQVYLCYITFRMSFYFTVKDAERKNSTSLLVFSPQRITLLFWKLDTVSIAAAFQSVCREANRLSKTMAKKIQQEFLKLRI